MPLAPCVFDVRAQKDMSSLVRHDKRETVGNEELSLVGDSMLSAVKVDRALTIAGEHEIDVGQNRITEVVADRERNIAAEENVEVGQVASLSVAANDSETVRGKRMTIAGNIAAPSARSITAKLVPSPRKAATSMAMGAIGGRGGLSSAAKGMVPSFNAQSAIGMLASGSISRAAATTISRRVGGAYFGASAANFALSTQLAYGELVGGAKLTAVKGSIATQVGAVLATTVGGALMRTAKENISLDSKLARYSVGGIASFKAGDAITLKAPSVSFRSAARMFFEAGGVSIELTPGGVTLKGDLGLDAQGKIKVWGSQDNITAGGG